MPGSLLKRLCRKLTEAVHRISGVVKGLKEAVHPRELQNRRRARRDGRKFDVAIPLHGLLQATEQHLDSSAVELPYFRTVEHHSRPVCLQTRLYFANKQAALFHAQFFR
jgi:hypothetical protein